MKRISQALVFCLMADAAWVAWGLWRHRDMWKWIVAYWAILTAKNAADWIAGKRRREHAQAENAGQAAGDL